MCRLQPLRLRLPYVTCSSCLVPAAGFPVDRLSRAEVVAGFYGLGLYWGNARSQNAAGHVVRGRSQALWCDELLR